MRGPAVFISFLAVCVSALLAFSTGERTLWPREIFTLLQGGGDPGLRAIAAIRLPRVLAGLLAGMSLSVSGTVFQALMRNPLADPFIMGVSGGASLGAALAMVFNLSSRWLVILSLCGGMMVAAAVHLLSAKREMGESTVILSGIAMGFICSSGVMILFAMAASDRVHRAVMWLMGDMSMARYAILPHAAVISLALILVILLMHRRLDIISMGSGIYSTLGIGQSQVRTLYWCASFLAAITVAVTGTIGFVGLIVPHTVRMVVGPAHRYLVPLAAASGAVFLVLCDTAGRIMVPPYQMPVGVITGFAGGIFFLLYMRRNAE